MKRPSSQRNTHSYPQRSALLLIGGPPLGTNQWPLSFLHVPQDPKSRRPIPRAGGIFACVSKELRAGHSGCVATIRDVTVLAPGTSFAR